MMDEMDQRYNGYQGDGTDGGDVIIPVEKTGLRSTNQDLVSSATRKAPRNANKCKE
jgi:hypothetical protein